MIQGLKGPNVNFSDAFLAYILSSDLFPVNIFLLWNFVAPGSSNRSPLERWNARGELRDALCGCLSQSGVESDHDQGTWIVKPLKGIFGKNKTAHTESFVEVLF